MRKLIQILTAFAIFLLYPTPAAPIVDSVEGITATLQGLQELKTVASELLQTADELTKSRVADIDSRLGIKIAEIKKLLESAGTKVEQATLNAIDKSLTETNDLLLFSMQGLQDASVDIDFRVNNAMINAIRAYTALPFIRVRPFVAVSNPAYLYAGRQQPFEQIELIGYFRPELGDVTARILNGASVPVSLGVGNRVFLQLSREELAKYEGKRVVIQLTYPAASRWYWRNERDTRDIWVTVLPAKIVSYEIVRAAALPDYTYDTPSLTIPFNVSAGAGEDKSPQTIRTVEELGRDEHIKADFDRIYDKDASRITGVTLSSQGGNNPTGDNSNTVNEASGPRFVVTHRVHGKPGNLFGNGSGANNSGIINVGLELAHRRRPVTWILEGAPTKGALTWGESVQLTPKATQSEPEKPIQSLLLRVTDHSFDPPMVRTLNLTRAHRTKFVTVETSAKRVTINVRSIPR